MSTVFDFDSHHLEAKEALPQLNLGTFMDDVGDVGGEEFPVQLSSVGTCEIHKRMDISFFIKAAMDPAYKGVINLAVGIA